MAKWQGNVILADPVSMEVGLNPTFRQILQQWALAHGNARWIYETHMPGDPLMATFQARGCVVDQSEIGSDGFLWVGPYKAYVGTCMYIPDEGTQESPKPQQESFNFPQELLYFFEQMQFTEEERNKVLDMTIREFLGTCKAAAESADSPQEETNPGTPPPWTLSKKRAMSGAAKCPICDKTILRIIDGEVLCPVCDTSFGDIDNLPDV
jgi:hypothetical protein